MLVADVYRRKISSEEAETGRFMVLKSALGFFPAVGEEFEVTDGSTTRSTRVDAVPCTCRGPEKPHDHYWVAWPGLRKRSRIELTPTGEGAYMLRVAD